ncbi:HgcAB-associated protein HgcC [Chloroflexota bacterium]
MIEKENTDSCCEPADIASCCKVEAMVSVDERGQMILPKDLRDRAGIRPGEKLAVTTWEKEGKIYCISLIRADELTTMVKGVLGPVMKDILQ